MMEKKKETWVHCLGFFLCGLILGVVANDQEMSRIGMQLTFGAFIAAGTTFFLEFCYRPGNIFGFYMDWLEKTFRDNPKNRMPWLFKPLGGCAYCQNTWIAIVYFVVLAVYFSVSWWLFIPNIILAHLFLTILDDIFWS